MSCELLQRSLIILSTLAISAGLGVVSPLAQQNHLDCWFDVNADEIRCPPVEQLEEGRGSARGSVSRLSFFRQSLGHHVFRSLTMPA